MQEEENISYRELRHVVNGVVGVETCEYFSLLVEVMTIVGYGPTLYTKSNVLFRSIGARFRSLSTRKFPFESSF